LCEICCAHGDASEDSNLLDRKIRRNHYIVYFEIKTKFWSSGEMQRCRVFKVTLRLAFSYIVYYLGYRQEATEVWKGTQRVQGDIVRGQVPYVTREMTSRSDVVTVGLHVVWPSPPPQSSRRACPTSVWWTVVQLVLRVRSCDNYTFAA
jgi:hypothetical protein